MRKPNFLIVGAAKSGTTSLARYLAKHDEIFIPDHKELRFFVADVIKKTSKSDPSYDYLMSSSVFKEDAYFEYFRGRKEKLLGEASIHYLYHHEQVIPQIHHYLGDVKIIIILRNPVERAISNWKYQDKDFLNFSDALVAENQRVKDGYNSFWYYKQLGLYHEQVKAYLDSFKDVEIVLFEDFVNNTESTVEEVFSFLGVSAETQASYYKKYNKTSTSIVPRTWFMRKILSSQKSINFFLKCYKKNLVPRFLYMQKDQLLRNQDKENLNEFYKDDLRKLEKLINKDLTGWYN